MEENYRIQELIETKAFHQLTDQEKTWVLAEMTAEEYTLRKSVVDETRLFLSQGVIETRTSEETKNKAAFILKQKANKKNRVAAIFTYKIPVFIPVAATILLLLTLPFAFPAQVDKAYIAEVKDTVHKVVYKTDTVVKEKEIIKEVPVTVVKYVQVSAPTSTITGNNQGTDRVISTDPKILLDKMVSQLKNQTHQSGFSSTETNALNDLIKRRDSLIYEW